MLVNLYAIDYKFQLQEGIEIQRILSPNIFLLEEFIEKHFTKSWASEAKAACYKNNPTCFIAIADKKIVGFACFDATTKGFFGPIGVDPNKRHQGIAKALILTTLHAMKEDGYAYAIIGSAGDNVIEMYKKVCHATPIELGPSVYQRMI